MTGPIIFVQCQNSADVRKNYAVIVRLLHCSEGCTLLRGVNEFLSIVSPFICYLSAIRHKVAGHNGLELLRVS